MTFTLVHAGKYRTDDRLKIQTIHKLNTTQKKQTRQNTAEQSNCGLVAFMTLGLETKWGYCTTLPSQFAYRFVFLFVFGHNPTICQNSTELDKEVSEWTLKLMSVCVTSEWDARWAAVHALVWHESRGTEVQAEAWVGGHIPVSEISDQVWTSLAGLRDKGLSTPIMTSCCTDMF